MTKWEGHLLHSDISFPYKLFWSRYILLMILNNIVAPYYDMKDVIILYLFIYVVNYGRVLLSGWGLFKSLIRNVNWKQKLIIQQDAYHFQQLISVSLQQIDTNFFSVVLYLVGDAKFFKLICMLISQGDNVLTKFFL